MNQAAEVVITVRVPADLVRHARAAAERNDETLSQVVRRALRAYVGRTPDQLDIEDLVRQ
jgi:predicted transcriptional regulator